MPTVLLVRHAQASFGTDDYDVLSELGREQAEILTEALVARGANVTRLVAGTAVRQRDTAAPLADRLGLELGTDERWNEYETDLVLEHHGAAEAGLDGAGSDGRPITSREFQDVLDGALTLWVQAGGKSASPQTWPTFQASGAAALAALGSELGSGETGVAVTSGGVIAAIAMELLGGHPDLLVRLNRVVVNTSVTKLVLGRSGASLLTFNDHVHIEAAGARLLSYR